MKGPLRARSLASFAALAAACSTPQPHPSPPPPSAPPPEPTGAATFADVGSPLVLAAAMEYPKAQTSEPVAPVSLTAGDGTGLRLVDYRARAVVDGPLAFTELHLRFANPEDRTIEGRFQLTLPEGAAISRLAMKSEAGWQEAEVVELSQAHAAYEDFLHRRQDPALLEKEAGNQFRARIFPIAARADKEIIVSFSQELSDPEADYALPLRGLPAIDHLSVAAAVVGASGGRAWTRIEHRGWVPDADFHASRQNAPRAIRAGALFAAVVTPRTRARPAELPALTVLFDTSASRAPGYRASVASLQKLVAALARGGDFDLTVLAFDQEVAPIYHGRASGFGAAQGKALAARRPLGASDLGAALARAASSRRVLVFGDAVATAGAREPAALVAAARKAGLGRIDVILRGGIRDRDAATALVRAGGGAVLDGDRDSAATLAKRLRQQVIRRVALSVPGARWVYPTALEGVVAGESRVVYGRLAGPDARLEIGAGTAARAVRAARAPKPLLERAAARARIAAFEAEMATLGDASSDAADSLRKQIIELSVSRRVLSRFTGLLVLQTEADYRRFGIERRGLASILTIEGGALALIDRDHPVLAAPAPRPELAGKDGKLKKKPAQKVAQTAMGGDVAGDAGPPPVADPPPVAEPPPPAPEARPAPRVADQRQAATGTTRLPAHHRENDREVSASGSSSVENQVTEARDVDGVVAAGAGAAAGAAAGPADEAAAEEGDKAGPPPLSGPFAEIRAHLDARDLEGALVGALAWQREEPGDTMALVALGEALEAGGHRRLAARAYGSLIDLFPSRADVRRFAAMRLERLEGALALAEDSFAAAVKQRPDHLTGHRLLAYARVRRGDWAGAFAALEAGLDRNYPSGRFAGGMRVLSEDLAIVGGAWIAAEPGRAAAVRRRLAARGLEPAAPSTRFVLSWETDGNDVDLHVRDARGGHAFFRQKTLASGGELYADVTTGYGPECFTIPGSPQAGPYRLQAHYYSRGPMGYGMGQLEIIRWDGEALSLESRPFVVMNDDAYVDLGTVK